MLKVISRSAFDLQKVLDTLVELAVRLCEADIGHIVRPDEAGNFYFQAHYGFTKDLEARSWSRIPFKAGRDTITGRALLEGTTVQILDARNDPEYKLTRALKLGGYRSMIGTPLLREGTPIGAFGLSRLSVRPFTEKQMALLTTFADQAVIAIENTRLINETREALERQTATSDILRVIASSPSDVQPVFDAIAESAKRLLGSYTAVVTRVIDGVVHLAASTAEDEATAHAVHGTLPYSLSSDRIHARVARTGQVVSTSDIERARMSRERQGIRPDRRLAQHLVVPMLRNGVAIGTIGITRRETGAFDDKTVDLLKTFADQAVIAIENARLFNETQELLARQTAMAQVLEVINSSPGDLKPVFDAILEQGDAALRGRLRCPFCLQLGDDMHQVVAMLGAPPGFADMFKASNRIGPGTGVGRLVRGESYVHIPDAADDEAYRSGHPVRRALVDIAGARTYLAVPIRRDDVMLGSFTIYRREVRLFSPEMIALVQSFAAQAAIAIDNARLFNETKEALEQQTATSEVLEVISSSPGELEPVFAKMLENAVHVCGASFGTMNFWDGEKFEIVADYNIPPDFAAYRQSTALRPYPGTVLATVVKTLRAAQVRDMRESPAYLAGVPMAVNMADIGGARTLMSVPMLKEGELVGVITIFRKEVRDLYRQAGRAGRKLHQAGRHRHREHAAAARTARAHQRSQRIPAAADRHRRRAQGDQPLGVRSAGGAGYAGRISRAAVRGGGRNHPPAEGRRLRLRLQAGGWRSARRSSCRALRFGHGDGRLTGRVFTGARRSHSMTC